jgi:hypothetical protein
MLRIDLELLMPSGVVYDVSTVDVAFMDSWYVVCKKIGRGVRFRKDRRICSYLF